LDESCRAVALATVMDYRLSWDGGSGWGGVAESRSR
jgi:hypothetical protein